MRIYLSGPMRGLPDNNFPEFHRVANILRDTGHDVLNPADSFDGKPGVDRHDCLRHDIQLILISDAVVVIAGWGNSPGACFEVAEAWQIGVPVYEYKQRRIASLGVSYDLYPLPQTSVVIPREYQYEQKIPLIGLAGYAKAGKDTCADALVSNGFSRIAFADPLKDIARAIGWDGNKDDIGRQLLQDLGVSLRDFISTSVWVERAEEAIEEIAGPVVISDVRFPNEVAMVRRRGGKVIRIERPGIEAVNGHISEHAIQGEVWDGVYINDSSLEELPDQFMEFIGDYVGALV